MCSSPGSGLPRARLADADASRPSARCSSSTSPIRRASTRPAVRSASPRAPRPIAALHRLAARLTDHRTALAAAVFLAVAPLHVRDSHYVKHDVPATLAIVLAYLAMARVWPCARADGRPQRDTLLAGAALRRRVLDALLLRVPGHPARARDRPGLEVARRARRAFGIWRSAAAASLVVFFALSPFLLVEPLTAMARHHRQPADRHRSRGDGRRVCACARGISRCCGPTPSASRSRSSASRRVWMLASAPGRARLLLAFPVPFLLFISNTAPASRYLNPVLPFLALFAAWALSRLSAIGRRPAHLLGARRAAAAPGASTSIRIGPFCARTTRGPWRSATSKPIARRARRSSRSRTRRR